MYFCTAKLYLVLLTGIHMRLYCCEFYTRKFHSRHSQNYRMRIGKNYQVSRLFDCLYKCIKRQGCFGFKYIASADACAMGTIFQVHGKRYQRVSGLFIAEDYFTRNRRKKGNAIKRPIAHTDPVRKRKKKGNAFNRRDKSTKRKPSYGSYRANYGKRSYGKTYGKREKGCGPPPRRENAFADYEGFSVGSVARYTCKSGYTSCGPKISSRCQTSGYWEKIYLRCQTNTWSGHAIRDRKVPFMEMLPRCQRDDGINVAIDATPTRNTKFEVFLNDKDDVIFGLFATFKGGLIGPNVKVNTRLLKAWGIPIPYPAFPFRMNNPFRMIIIDKTAKYDVKVNGKNIVTFLDRSFNKVADMLKITGDLKVHRVHVQYTYN